MAAETEVETTPTDHEDGDAPEPEVVDVEPVVEEDVPAETNEQLDRAVAEEQEKHALVLREPGPPPTVVPSVKEWEAMRAMAETVCETEFVPRDFRGRPEAVLAAILAGRELGIGPMQSLKDISIIDGRPALAAHLVLAKLRRGGVEVLVSASTGERAFIRARRKDTGEEAEVEWTIAEAQKAGLVGKANWSKYPADMLWARCVGRLGRRLGSDLLAGMPYTAEEVADFDSSLDEPTTAGYTTAPMTARRVEGPGEPDVPRTWAAMNERLLAAYGSATAADFWIFVKQLTKSLYGKESRSDLDQAQLNVIGQKSGTAVLKLLDLVQRELPPPTRSELQEAFSFVHDGIVLDGPEWAMDPEEAKAGRPARGEPGDAEQDGNAAGDVSRAAESNSGSSDGSTDTPDGSGPENASDAETVEEAEIVDDAPAPGSVEERIANEF